ncbi:MAG: hypothetical protein RLZZ214_4236 [Verrucomicrobiota bacterium]|jgi:hypothetical protein
MNFRFFLSVFLVPILSMAAIAQSKVMVRFAAQSLPEQMPQVVMTTGEVNSPPFEISAESFSQPQVATGRIFALRAVGGNVDFAKVQLPENGSRFIVLLVLAGGGKVSPVVIPDDRSAFRGGDVYVHNSSGKLVLGELGTTKFNAKPGNGSMVRPAGVIEEQYYEVRFAYEDNGAPRMFSSARWPAGGKERCYLFFYTDLRNPERVLYRVISEVLQPEVKLN